MTAYSIVLGHSIIPHHHHDEEHEMSQSIKHNDHNHHHNGDTDDDGSLSHEFAKYLHSSGTGDIYQKSDLTLNYNLYVEAYLGVVFDFSLKASEDPPPIRRLIDQQVPVSFFCLSPKGLRAPPLV